MALRELPSGTVTLLFTDIEGSTRLLEEFGERYRDLLAEHRLVLRTTFSEHGGMEVDTQGDAFFYAFESAESAALAAERAQQALAATPVRVRMGIHTGEPIRTDEGYVGLDVHKAARICAAAHGGQVVVSHETRALLDDVSLTELGEHRLKDLTRPQPLYQFGDGDFPPLKALFNVNLPVQPNALVGRERELREAGALLASDETRLLTLTGPGGTGKTRLALQLGAEAAEDFPAGVHFIPLAPVADPALVAATIAKSLGVKEQTGEELLTTLKRELEDRRLLLVLDNFEHLLAAAPAVGELLSVAPGLRAIATSRERLRLGAEREYPVSPLGHEGAVALFCDRSALPADDTIAEICRRLDHLPLGIELAAARARLLPPPKLLERLELRLLSHGARDAPERQQTLVATIEWSHDLLLPEEQGLFRRLAVFAGGWTLEAAEDVAGADLDLVASLLDKSLIRIDDERFTMLETIRAYARERLEASGEAADVRRRHAGFVLALAEEADRHAFDREQGVWLERLGAEHDNIRAALGWGVEQQEAVALRLCGLLGFFWFAQGHWREARSWCDRAAAGERQATPEVAARAAEVRGLYTALLGDLALGTALSDQALATWRALGDRRRLGQSLVIRQMVVGPHDHEAYEVFCREAVAVARSCGDDAVLGISLTNAADLALLRGEYDEARSFARESAEVLARNGDDFNRSGALVNGASAALELGELDAAAAGYEEALVLARPLEAVEMVAWAFYGLAAVAGHRGQSARAVRLTGAADALLAAHGIPHVEWFEERLRNRTLADARSALGEDAFAAHLNIGGELTADEAAEYALETPETSSF